MSRLEEVEADKWAVDRGDLAIGRFRLQCASPNDIAQWHNDKCRTLAAEVDARDAVIKELLEILRFARGSYFGSITAHERACEIAGRTE